MPIGRLENWIADRGFGFLRREGAEEGVTDFVHVTALKQAGIHDPAIGDVYEYALESWSGRTRTCAMARLHRAPVDEAAQ